MCVEPPEHLVGFRRFEHLVHRTEPAGGPGDLDLDLTVYGLRRYCALALPVGEPARTALREVRAGVVALDQVLARLDRATAELEAAAADAALPEACDVEAVDRFLVSAYLRTWAG